MGTTPHSNRPRSRGAIRLALTTIVAAVMVAGSTLSARAVLWTEEEFDHYIECFRLMIVDPAEHARLCLPYNGPGPDGSTLSPPNVNYPPAVFLTTYPPGTVPTTTVVPEPTSEPTTTIDCDYYYERNDGASQASEYCPPPS